MDLLVDSKLYRYGRPMWLARVACGWMPQSDLFIYLDAEPDMLLRRKQEVSSKALELGRASYLDLAHSNKHVKIIDASLTLDLVILES
jgi:hypothetical protein